jgi:hypothetical protein
VIGIEGRKGLTVLVQNRRLTCCEFSGGWVIRGASMYVLVTDYRSICERSDELIDSA